MSGMLCFSDDRMPGITRKRAGLGWGYWDHKGNRITDRDEIDRLNRIGLPPAYGRAWFCADPNGHIQAIGYDDKGRKQYRYHPDFRAQQDADKFGRCAAFGRALPKLRRQVARDLKRPRMDRRKAVAAVVRLLDESGIRVGNENYTRQSGTFGATTLRTRHARLDGSTVRLRFVGKSGRKHEISIDDRLLARIVRRCQDLPGQHLFAYLDHMGEVRPVSSTEVNEYIRSAMGDGFSAKHFRTWTASVIAYEKLAAAGEGRVPLKSLLQPVADALGNTPPIAKKSYVHPRILEAAAMPSGRPILQRFRNSKYLSSAERGLISFLELTEDCPPQRST